MLSIFVTYIKAENSKIEEIMLSIFVTTDTLSHKNPHYSEIS